MLTPEEILMEIAQIELSLKHSALSGDQRHKLEIELETLKKIAEIV